MDDPPQESPAEPPAPQEPPTPQEPDCYDELAKEAPEPPAPADSQDPSAPEPVKRKRGRPLGSRNKPKPPPEDPEPTESDQESEPVTPIKRPRASARKPRQQAIPVLDVDFQSGYGGAGPPKPGRMRRQTTASTLMELIAGAAAQRGERERDRRRTFYEKHIPP